jgi:hypothetical protein
MKHLATTLSFMILLLMATPCHDYAQDNTLLKATQADHKTETNHSHQDTDLCSPFCVCQCCQSNVIVAITPVQCHIEGFVFYYYSYTQSLEYPGIFEFLIPPKS